MQTQHSAQETNPFIDTVSLEPRDEILAEVTRMCLNAPCIPRIESEAGVMQHWAREGGRITPAAGARLILERLGCPRVRNT
jgi:hypothetical protein